METIKVNMSPNPLDVQTIHASQNDGEARQWGFELHNNGDVIDASEISDQLVFKAYKGGTEQLLPENGSTPTTSPFIGDIKYPQGLLADQEFTYRQSPTEEDGFAKITDIKGNTLVWNQLVTNGNFVNTDNWVGNGTKTVSNNTMTYAKPSGWNALNNSVTIPIVADHKYLVTYSAYVETNTAYLFWTDGTGSSSGEQTIYVGTTWQNFSIILTATRNNASGRIPWFDGSNAFTLHLKNYMFIDLTMMGLDALTLDEVKEWLNAYYPLPYYDFNQGSLLSFNGNGIKTVGKNKLKMPSSATLNGISFNVDADGQIQITGTATAQTDFYLYGTSGRYDDMSIMSSTYTFSCRKDSTTTGLNFFLVGQQTGTRIGVQLDNTSLSQAVALDGSDKYRVFMRVNNGTTINTKVALQLEFGSTATDYEPYASSTLSLPISTYFPTGMKSAGSVYDELTPTKAITRIGAVDLGTITYTYDGECFIGKLPSDAKVLSANTETLNSITPIYQINNWTTVKFNKANMTLGTGVNRYICIFNSSYTDPSAFKSAMNKIYLYYELSTPTETSFTTASLVTENAEIPLSNEDGVLVGKCTEQLSSESGFFDAKIKLADGDGDVYSNKIQLHVERKPS